MKKINDETVGWRGCGRCGRFYYGKHTECPHEGQKLGGTNSALLLIDKLMKTGNSLSSLLFG